MKLIFNRLREKYKKLDGYQRSALGEQICLFLLGICLIAWLVLIIVTEFPYNNNYEIQRLSQSEEKVEKASHEKNYDEGCHIKIFMKKQIVVHGSEEVCSKLTYGQTVKAIVTTKAGIPIDITL